MGVTSNPCCHLADTFIQSDLQIRKINQNYKLKLFKYYIYTFKKM